MNDFIYNMDNTFPSKVTVIGAARSGLASAEYLVKKGVKVFISDTCDPQKIKELLMKKGLESVAYEGGLHSDKVLDAELIILSPGVPSDINILQLARKKGIPIWSEMELGFRVSKVPFLAVTGSTGKSTTVSLIGEILKAAGIEAVVAGNIGIPVISQVTSLSPGAYVVAEVSSFQLETIDKFNPRAAAVLNLMKNHLDRYRSEHEYYEAKKQVAKNFTKDNFLVLNALDPLLMEWAEELKLRTNIIYTGNEINNTNCFWYDNESIYYRFDNRTGKVLDISDMKLKGVHNYQNACSAAAIAMVAGADIQSIANGINNFKGLEHRLEYVAEYRGVKWFNDSKSTTAESIIAAIDPFPSVYLIAGGRDKGCEFSVVSEVIKKKTKGVFLIGEAAQRMKDEWSEYVPVEIVDSLEDAIKKTSFIALNGDTVVFSPGCSSFDMFNNYEERGNVFKKLVIEIHEGAIC